MLSKITSLTQYVESNLDWPSITSGELASFSLLIAFAILSVIESQRPNRKWPLKSLRQSYRTNIGLFFFNSAVLSIMSASSLFILAEHNSYDSLLNKLSNPLLKVAISFLLLDLIFYIWHKASHSFDCLWLFHRVHHNDPYLNVSTAFRIHLIELLIATGLKAAYIFALGVDPAWVLVYEILMISFVMFHHTNISFPGEKWLGKLFIVPYLHRVHHSTQRHEHDSNYGAVLAIWDRLFGTLNEREPVEIGIGGQSPQTLFKLIKFGFTSPLQPAAVNVPYLNIHSMIAEAAYFKAEKRGFYPGYDLYDWLEAETEILRQNAQIRPAVISQSRSNKGVFDFIRLSFNINRPLLS